jgi:hypothetical protein
LPRGSPHRGRSNADIAAALHIAEATLKTYLGRLRAKLDVHDRVQLVIFAYDTGWWRPARVRPRVVPRNYRSSRPQADDFTDGGPYLRRHHETPEHRAHLPALAD